MTPHKRSPQQLPAAALALLLCLCLSMGKLAMAQTDTQLFLASTLPAELKEDANAVVRVAKESFTVNSLYRTTTTIYMVVTVLNEEGDHWAYFNEYYDDSRTIKNFFGAMYDQYGRRVRKLKPKDLKDYIYEDGISVLTDTRLKVADMRQASYPYTVEYGYTINTNQTFYYPHWMPQYDEETAVQAATFNVTLQPGETLRYRENNLPEGVKVSHPNGPNSYQWQIKNVKPFTVEPYTQHPRNQFISVYTAPGAFDYDGYTGNMSSWEGYGKWINGLNAGRGQLPAERVAEVQKLVASASTQTEKARLIYEYMQNRTRYVSIQLGIGGYQPFAATEVDRTGYGDCKALTNYTKAMLEVAGIKSYYTLVRAGSNARDMITDFPSSQFNHAFLCVPVEQDTFWLECTSQQVPFGYTGYFTSDRNVLVITEEGGKVVRTPAYTLEDNTQYRSATVTLEPSGNASATVVTEYNGLNYDRYRGVLNEGLEERKKFVFRRVDIPSFDVNAVDYTEFKNRVPTVKEELSLTIRNAASKSGDRLFLTPNLMNKWSRVPKADDDRTKPLHVETAWKDVDTVQYTLPEGYRSEFIPEATVVNSPFGTYKASASLEGSTLTYVRELSINSGNFEASEYNEMRDFFKAIKKADRQKIVFVKGT